MPSFAFPYTLKVNLSLPLRTPQESLDRSPIPHVTPIFTPLEEEQLKKLGAVRTEHGKWVLPNGREMISKSLMRKLLTYLHQGSHGGPQAMCDAIL
jgi:hypothetical protein